MWKRIRGGKCIPRPSLAATWMSKDQSTSVRSHQCLTKMSKYLLNQFFSHCFTNRIRSTDKIVETFVIGGEFFTSFLRVLRVLFIYPYQWIISHTQEHLHHFFSCCIHSNKCNPDEAIYEKVNSDLNLATYAGTYRKEKRRRMKLTRKLATASLNILKLRMKMQQIVLSWLSHLSQMDAGRRRCQDDQ